MNSEEKKRGGKRDGAGRPFKTNNIKTSKRTISIDDKTHAAIKEIGWGNFSDGIRVLYSIWLSGA